MISPQMYIDVNMSGQDVVNLSALYIGEKNTNGSWKITAENERFLIERREAGSWITKGVFFGGKPDFDGEDFDSADFNTTLNA